MEFSDDDTDTHGCGCGNGATRPAQGQSTTITIPVTAAGVTGPTGKVAIYDGKHKIYASYADSDQVVGSKSNKVTLKVVRR